MGTDGSSLLPMEKPDVLPVCRDACRKPVRPADSLKSRRDVSVIQVGIIAAVAADELIVIGVAAFGTAFHEMDRLTSQDHCPPQRRLIMDLHDDLGGLLRGALIAVQGVLAATDQCSPHFVSPTSPTMG